MATFFGRVFSSADKVFTEDMLRPEKQSLEDYIDGINNIVETQKRVATHYFKDGSIDYACPPLAAILNIMVHGEYEGMTAESPEFRAMFEREQILASDWYQERLVAAKKVRERLWRRHTEYLSKFLDKPYYKSELDRLDVHNKLEHAKARLAEVEQRDSLVGTIGTDPALVDFQYSEPAKHLQDAAT